MLQLILAGSFVAMILTPALVAAASGKKEFDPEPATETAPVRKAASRSVEPVSDSAALNVSAIETPARLAARKRNPRPVNRNASKTVFAEAQTLPLHRTLGLAGR